jgi:hypothetical protein
MPSFKFTNPYDLDGVDSFNSFLGIKGVPENNVSKCYLKINKIGELGFDKHYNDILNIRYSNYQSNKYIFIKKDLKDEVDEFFSRYMRDKVVLGVHYRGTDKLNEAPAITYDRVVRNINYYLDQFPETETVFVSSDETNFINFISNSSIKCHVVYRDDTFRSSDDSSIHHSDQSKYSIQHDALVNCLILSRCNALMKTASILSSISKLINPDLPLVMLNKPYKHCTWFPERDFIDAALYDPVP